MTIYVMSKRLVRETLNDLPSAQPETKQGEWIPHSEKYTFPGTEETSSGGVICSSCGFRTHNRMHKLIGCPYNYCPICGASMRKENKMGDMCTDNRFELIEKFKKKLIESTNIETSPEEMKAIDNLLFRFWQMGWLDIIDRMPLVKESATTLMYSDGNSVSAKAFRNAGRFIQNAIDGEAPEFEKIPSVQPEPHWIPLREGPPKEKGQYLVCYKLDGTSGIMTAMHYPEGWIEEDKDRKRGVARVLAWMPLPEPYQEENSNE